MRQGPREAAGSRGASQPHAAAQRAPCTFKLPAQLLAHASARSQPGGLQKRSQNKPRKQPAPPAHLLTGGLMRCMSTYAARPSPPSASRAASSGPYRLLPPPSRCGLSTKSSGEERACGTEENLLCVLVEWFWGWTGGQEAEATGRAGAGYSM